MFYITLSSLILTIVSFMYFFLIGIKRLIFQEKVSDIKLKLIISSSCGILFWLLTYSLHAVYERIQNPHIKEGIEEYAGTFGDLVGGTLNPILGLFGIIVGGLAFYAQYQANKQVQEQFVIQQFESKLFKLLDIYQTNVDHLNFTTRKSGKKFNGKSVFPHLVYHFNDLKGHIKTYNESTNNDINKIISNDYLTELSKTEIISEKIKDFILLDLTYVILFYGVGVNGRKSVKSILKDKYDLDYLKKLLNYLSNKPIEYKKENEQIIKEWVEKSAFAVFSEFSEPNNEKFDKYFNGIQNNLSHYYRHLYMMITFINNQKGINYNQKWEYSKFLRSQLSNHEQELFFLNSISILGREWELLQTSENNKLITKFDLIKNITKGIRDKYNIERFYPNIEYEDVLEINKHREYLEKNIYK